MAKFLKCTAVLLVIIVVFGAAMYALNLHTAPIIEQNNAGAANDRLNLVMEGKGYEDITSTLADLPEGVKAVHKETSGLGYVIETSAKSQYTGGDPMDIIIGVSLDGKIVGIKLVSHSESLIFAEDYPSTYIGKDSALAGVELYAGSTYSSTAFKGAVESAMNLLASNGLVSAGVKDDSQVLSELIPTVAPGFSKVVEIEVVSGNITKAYKSENGVGYAYIVKNGDASYLAVVNAMGCARVYDTEGKDVTADNKAVADEAISCAKTSQTSYKEEADKRFASMMGEITDITEIAVDTYNTVAYAASFKVGDATYYGFYSRSVGFQQMDVYIVIDENGAIAKFDAKTLIFEEEYFMNFGGIPAGYKSNFAGLDQETFKDQYIIATATMTSNAVKQSTEDAFAAFRSINNGGKA